MHVHLVRLHRISADDRAGGFILPRESVVPRKKEALSLVLSFLMERKNINNDSLKPFRMAKACNAPASACGSSKVTSCFFFYEKKKIHLIAFTNKFSLCFHRHTVRL